MTTTFWKHGSAQTGKQDVFTPVAAVRAFGFKSSAASTRPGPRLSFNDFPPINFRDGSVATPGGRTPENFGFGELLSW
jgi:hypothetical protein